MGPGWRPSSRRTRALLAWRLAVVEMATVAENPLAAVWVLMWIRPPPQEAGSAGGGAAGGGGGGDGNGGRDAAAGGGDWMRLDVRGGYLLFSPSLQRLDAHCSGNSHPASCKCDRTLRAQRGATMSGRGRPLARHLLWLEEGLTMDAGAHRRRKSTAGAIDTHARRFHIRQRFEQDYRDDPTAQAILAAERARIVGEEHEPRIVP